MVALAWTPSIPPRTVDEKPKHLPKSEVVETTSVGKDQEAKEVAKQERSIFEDNAASFTRTTTATGTIKEVIESVIAYVISSAPPSVHSSKSSGENMAAVAVPVNLVGKETAGALTKLEDNKGSGDKKQEGNTFLAANKTLDDSRAERLEQEHEYVFLA